MELPGRRQRGKSKRKFMYVVREDMHILDVKEDDAEDGENGERWRETICCGKHLGKFRLSQKRKNKSTYKKGII